MIRLLILRHAKSDWGSDGVADFDRPLAPRGEQAAPKMGAYMAANSLVPDLALCSTARRARETWQLVAPAFTTAPETRHLDQLYHASPHDVLEVLRSEGGTANTICIVGHHPAVDGMALMLAGSGDQNGLDRIRTKYPTAALAVLSAGLDDWAALAPGAGELERFVTPKDLT